MFSITEFQRLYPNDDACLEEILKRKYSDFICPKCSKTKLYRIRDRKAYSCSCGYQVYPLVGTIFQGSPTPLTSWFYVIYVMSQSKGGVSAAMIQRHLGVKYDTAWRMCYKVRDLMQDEEQLTGTVEVDETYIRAKPWRTTRPLGYKGKARMVMGMVERGGRAKAVIIPNNRTNTLYKHISDNVPVGSKVYTDGLQAYFQVGFLYKHQSVNHSIKEWVRDDVHTQNVENLWSGIKLGIQGVHKSVSPQHLQNYLNYFTWVYSQRFSSESFFDLLSRL